MRLQFRITLAFLALVAVLTGSTTYVLYERIQSQFRSDFEESLELARQAIRKRLHRDADALRHRVEAVAESARLTELLQDLKHGALDEADHAQLLRTAQALADSAQLDTLWIVDEHLSRRVLSASHRSVRQTLPKVVDRMFSRGLQGHVVVVEAIDGRPGQVPVLEVATRRGRLCLIGGRVLGQGVAEDLRASAIENLELTFYGPVGDGGEERIVASTFSDPPAPGTTTVGYQTARVSHTNPGDPDPSLVVAIHLSRDPLTARLQTLWQISATMAAMAAFLAWLLGWWLARRITRPIEALADATRRVAAGDRSVELPLETNDEVGDLVRSFGSMLDELEGSEAALRNAERIAAWSDIARELAHEIKNPLTPIQMAMQTVRRAKVRHPDKFDEVFEEATATVLEEVERLKTIVTEFSQFARMPNPNPHECDLNELIHSSVVLYGASEDVTVVEDLGTLPPTQLLDADRITQVIQNLLKNAIQATEAGDRPGRVVISTRELEDGDVEMTVEDNGCGVREEDIPRIFTPYYTAKSGGTGLGLAVVHRIISGHGGRVGVRSKEGEGTCFVIRLPGPRNR